MIISVGDLLRVTVKGRYLDAVDLINVFHLRCDAKNVVDNEVTVGFGLFQHVYKDAMLPQLTTAVRFDLLKVERMDEDYVAVEGYDISLHPEFTGAGLVSAEALSPQNTLTVKQVRANNTMRHGYKRFSGLGEGLNIGGVLQLDSGTKAAIASKFYGSVKSGRFIADVWNPYEDSDYRHVGVKRVEDGLALNPVVVEAFAGAQVNPIIGSQNSRKYGYGS